MKITENTVEKMFGAKRCSRETMELNGYELVEELFCDNSGFGADNEPAYTRSQAIDKARKILREHGVLYVALTAVGQFQVYLGFFRKSGKKISKKIANNTLEINYPDGRRAIRLHDTDVVTFENGHVILNSGGWQTRTTKDRINQHLPNRFIIQKNFQWFVVNSWNDKKPIEFKDGMKLKV